MVEVSESQIVNIIGYASFLKGHVERMIKEAVEHPEQRDEAFTTIREDFEELASLFYTVTVRNNWTAPRELDDSQIDAVFRKKRTG